MIYKLNIYIVLCFVIFSLFSSSLVYGQKFEGGLLLGFNAAQIRGDDMGGFDKLGLNVGLTAIYPLAEKSELGISLLYSQRGSQSDLINNDVGNKFVLNYAVVPLTFSYKDWYISQGDFYRIRFTIGAAYGRLLNSSVNDYKKGENPDVDIIMDAYRSNDISWLVGASYYFNDRVGIAGRYTRAVFPLLDIKKTPDAFTNDLLPFSLTFQLVYLL